MKPYTIGGTITGNMLENEIGAINIGKCQLNGSSPTNMLEFGFSKNEIRIHEAQKPLKLIEYLIQLTIRDNQIVLDPFMGSRTTAIAATNLNRQFIGFEVNPAFYAKATKKLENLTTDKIGELPLFQQSLL